MKLICDTVNSEAVAVLDIDSEFARWLLSRRPRHVALKKDNDTFYSLEYFDSHARMGELTGTAGPETVIDKWHRPTLTDAELDACFQPAQAASEMLVVAEVGVYWKANHKHGLPDVTMETCVLLWDSVAEIAGGSFDHVPTIKIELQDGDDS